MTIYVGSSKIKQIYIGGDTTIRQVYYGRYLVYEIDVAFKSNTPASSTIYLTPGLYEVYAVGGGGGSIGGGGGGSGDNGSKTVAAIAGQANP